MDEHAGKKQGKAYCGYVSMQDINSYVQQITSGGQ